LTVVQRSEKFRKKGFIPFLEQEARRA